MLDAAKLLCMWLVNTPEARLNKGHFANDVGKRSWRVIHTAITHSNSGSIMHNPASLIRIQSY